MLEVGWFDRYILDSTSFIHHFRRRNIDTKYLTVSNDKTVRINNIKYFVHKQERYLFTITLAT